MVALSLQRDQLLATYAPTTIPLSFWAVLSQGSLLGKSELQAGNCGLCVRLDHRLGMGVSPRCDYCS